MISSTNCAEPETSAGTSIAKTASELEPTSLDDQTEYVVDSGTVTAYVKPLRGVHLAYDLLPLSWRTEEMRQMLGEYDAHRRALGKPPWTDAEVKRKIAQWTTRTPSEVISAAYRSIAKDLVVESAEAAEMPEPEPQQQDLLEEFDPYAE